MCLVLASVAKMGGGSVHGKGQAWERHREGQGDSSRDSAIQTHGQVGIELCPDGPKAQEALGTYIWLPSPHQYLTDAPSSPVKLTTGALLTSGSERLTAGGQITAGTHPLFPAVRCRFNFPDAWGIPLSAAQWPLTRTEPGSPHLRVSPL